jgi:hypothetical protein
MTVSYTSTSYSDPNPSPASGEYVNAPYVLSLGCDSSRDTWICQSECA